MSFVSTVKKVFSKPASEPVGRPARAPSPEPKPLEVPEIDATSLIDDRQNGRRLLLDCREPFEWRLGRIPGSLHIPMNQIPYRLSELDKGDDIVVVCAHGERSHAVAGFLIQHGFTAGSLKGGVTAWKMQGGSVESDFGAHS